MHRRCLREIVVVDCALVETVQKLTFHKPGGLPVRIAVYQRVAEVFAVLGKTVEGYQNSVRRVEHSDGVGHIVAVEAYLQRAQVLVEDTRHGIHTLCVEHDGQERDNQYKSFPHSHFIGSFPCSARYWLA